MHKKRLCFNKKGLVIEGFVFHRKVCGKSSVDVHFSEELKVNFFK
jgi:hypothetical protein